MVTRFLMNVDYHIRYPSRIYYHLSISLYLRKSIYRSGMMNVDDNGDESDGISVVQCNVFH